MPDDLNRINQRISNAMIGARSQNHGQRKRPRNHKMPHVHINVIGEIIKSFGRKKENCGARDDQRHSHGYCKRPYVQKKKMGGVAPTILRIPISRDRITGNSSAYCIEMHAADARKHGISESKIYALSAWKESPLFSDEKRALLALTEEVTLITNKGLSDETYAELQRYFDEVTIVQAIMQVVVINAWNRISVSSRKMHAHQQVVVDREIARV